ncbi:hypothetical protein Pelo_16170 [Pelomyxa schiedti]|nr:hypothetical protein Pelo_16170 [Pelomyxa schiedti]
MATLFRATCRATTDQLGSVVDWRWAATEERARFFEEVVSVLGVAAVGKTTLIQMLCNELKNELVREERRGTPYHPTLGLNVHTVHWGARCNNNNTTTTVPNDSAVSASASSSKTPEAANSRATASKIYLLNIDFYDLGFHSAEKSTFLTKEHLNSPDVCIYVVSSVDASSFAWLLSELENSATSTSRRGGKMVVITKCDLVMQSHITHCEMNQLLNKYPSLPVIALSRVDSTKGGDVAIPWERNESTVTLLNEITNQSFMSS